VATNSKVGKYLAEIFRRGERTVIVRISSADIVAETIPHLVASAVYLRDNAVIQLQALQLSRDVTYLSAEEAKRAMEVALFNPLPLERMWGYWIARVRRSMPDIE
jgi:hypothetical protein